VERHLVNLLLLNFILNKLVLLNSPKYLDIERMDFDGCRDLSISSSYTFFISPNGLENFSRRADFSRLLSELLLGT
jgi:hypothetical protein